MVSDPVSKLTGGSRASGCDATDIIQFYTCAGNCLVSTSSGKAEMNGCYRLVVFDVDFDRRQLVVAEDWSLTQLPVRR